MLNPDAQAFRRRAEAEGIQIGWYELDGGIHGSMGFPVGRDARKRMGIGKILQWPTQTTPIPSLVADTRLPYPEAANQVE
jgi:hypothetical protein